MSSSPGLSPGTSILLTGGAGFIGSHLAARLTGAGARVTILDDRNDAYSTRLKQESEVFGEHQAFHELGVKVGGFLG